MRILITDEGCLTPLRVTANDSTVRDDRAIGIDNRPPDRSPLGALCAQVGISGAADALDHRADRHSLRWRSAPVHNSRAEAFDAARDVNRYHEQKQRAWLNSARYTREGDARTYTGALRKDMERNQAGGAMGTRGVGHATMAWGGAAWLLAVCSHPVLAACQFSSQGEGRVSTVIDARTFKLDDGREVRLAGIEPAMDDKTTGVRSLARLIDGREVTLHGTDDRPDRYGRQPAFVFLKNSDVAVQTELLARGEALVSATVTDKPCAAEMSVAESRARLAKSGFWSAPDAIKNSESPGDILTRIGQFSVVEGRILSARQAGATFYINFGRQWTRDFAVTISRRMMPSFQAAGIDLKALRNQRIRVRGWVEKRGGPRIEATQPGQIELIDATDDVAKRIVPEDTVSRKEGE